MSPRDLAKLPIQLGSFATGSRSDTVCPRLLGFNGGSEPGVGALAWTSNPPPACGPSHEDMPRTRTIARAELVGATLSRMPDIDPIPLLKRQLGVELATLLDGWNADDVAVMIRTDRPRISELRRGKLDRFSLETLIRYVERMGRKVDVVTSRPPARVRTRVR